MDRQVKKAPPPLPLPESDYPPVQAHASTSGGTDNIPSGMTTFSGKPSPTTLRARRFPPAAARHSHSDMTAASPTSSQAPVFSRSPVTTTPTGTSGGFRSIVSREALVTLAGDGSHGHSMDSVADILAAADMQRGVTVIYPQREGSEVDAEDPESPTVGPDASVGNANQDLAQVRVEGYFDSNVGVLIPNDLPKSTLLYVLTASDGRDNMFKCIQYFLQLVICFLYTPSLFSPEMQVFTSLWAEHFYRNYNTIRHGRSLFKMGRGFLNLFTAQAVASRLWTRYGDDIRITLYPVTWRMAALLLRVDTSLRVVGLALVTEKMRLQLGVTAAVGPASDGDDELSAGVTDAKVSYYYSQARMRAHMKQQQRLRAEANALLTDNVYTHVSKAELGARLPSATVGGSPVSGTVSEGVSPTSAFHMAHSNSSVGLDKVSPASHSRPFYVRDLPHGGSGGGVGAAATGLNGSFGFPTGSYPLMNSQGTQLSSKGGSWVVGQSHSAGGSGGGSAGAGAGAGAGTGLLASTRQTVEVPSLEYSAQAEDSTLEKLDVPDRAETAAPTPDAPTPLSGETVADGSSTTENNPSFVPPHPPHPPHTLPIGLGSLQAHGLRLPGSTSPAPRQQEEAGEDGNHSLGTSPRRGPASSTHSTGGGGGGGRPPRGPISLSTTVTEDGTQRHPHTPGMEDFTACTTLSAADPRFEQLRRASQNRHSVVNTPKLKETGSRRRTAAPLMDTEPGAASVSMLSPELSTRVPSFVYDAADMSLRQSSDSDEPLSQEGPPPVAGALARSHTFAMASSPQPAGSQSAGGSPAGMDPWMSAVHTASLVPAAIATPSHWRKKPNQFNTLLMVLLGVRSCSAAIRRFLRDATLVSSERFFNTDIIERHRPRIHKTFNYAWLVVAIIDLLLNTIRLVQPGWTKFATARQNVRCRCGCAGDDPSDVVWRTSDFIARRKTDLVFPELDLDYGAPAVSYITYFDAADPAHMMPACSHCGYLYKEVSKVSAENEPTSSKPQWLKMYEDAAANSTNNMSSHSAQEIAGAVGGGVVGGGVGLASSKSHGAGASSDPLFPAGTVDRREADFSHPNSAVSVQPGGFGTLETIVETDEGGDLHEVSILYLPYLMRRVFNYIWLLRCHANWSSTLLLQLRYSAELFLAWKYCFGGYEPYRTDSSIANILHPLGAVAGFISASVGLLRVIESAPK